MRIVYRKGSVVGRISLAMAAAMVDDTGALDASVMEPAEWTVQTAS
jgi:hypothetical protein